MDGECVEVLVELATELLDAGTDEEVLVEPGTDELDELVWFVDVELRETDVVVVMISEVPGIDVPVPGTKIVIPGGSSGLPHLHRVTGKPPPGTVVGTGPGVVGTPLVELAPELGGEEVPTPEALGVELPAGPNLARNSWSTSTAVPAVSTDWRG